MSKKKKTNLFKKVRGSYLPNNTIGALTYIPFLTAAIWFPIWQVMEKLSIANTIFHIFVFYVCLGVFMTWFASKNS